MSFTCAKASSPEKWEQLVPSDEPQEIIDEKREQRRQIMEALLDNDLVVKLRSEDGTLPFLDHPRDGVSVRELANYIGAPYSRIVEGLRVLDWQRLAVFFTRDKIKNTWFEDAPENIENFAMTSDEVRGHLYDLYDSEVVRALVMKAIDDDLMHTAIMETKALQWKMNAKNVASRRYYEIGSLVRKAC